MSRPPREIPVQILVNSDEMKVIEDERQKIGATRSTFLYNILHQNFFTHAVRYTEQKDGEKNGDSHA